VGIEGGVCDIEGRMFECAWVAIVDKKGVEGIAGGLYFELPRKVAEKIRAGGELGPIMEEIMKFDVKRTSGAIGVFTKGQLDRKQAYVQIVLSALIKFVSPEWFI
jgi:non-canonical (house-cleaning) NTP pyrophosphatase